MNGIWALVWLATFLLILGCVAAYELAKLLRHPPRRFSLRILLFAITIAAVILAWFAILWHYYPDQFAR